MLRCAQHDRHCDYQTLNTERTEHRRDLSVEALEARRPQRTSNLVAVGLPVGYLTGAAKFLADDASHNLLDGLFRMLHVAPQCRVDERLIVTATGFIDLLLEPCQHVIVQTDGDPRLALRHVYYRASLRFAEVVFTFHALPRIAGVRERWRAYPTFRMICTFRTQRQA